MFSIKLMNKFLTIIILALCSQLLQAQNKIGINYVKEVEVSQISNDESRTSTEFNVSQDGFASKIRFLNRNNQNQNLFIELRENSGSKKPLVAGPYAINLNNKTEGWIELEFPAAIPVFKEKSYILSIFSKADNKSSSGSSLSNSSGSNPDTGNSNKTNSETEGNNQLFKGQNSIAVLIFIYTELTSGTIGNSQTITYDTSPSSLSLSIPPSGGTGTYTYQWQSSSDSINWSDIHGADQATYPPPALKSNTWYRLIVSSGNFPPVTSNNVLIQVFPPLIPGIIGKDQVICHNLKPAALSQISQPSGGTGIYTYQWQISPENATWGDIPGAVSVFFSPPELGSNTWFRLNITSGICGTVSSNSVLITVNPPLIAGAIGVVQTICNNTTPDTLFQITAPAGGTGSYVFQWQSSVNGSTWSNIPGANQISFNPPSLTSTTWFRLNATSGTCGTVSSDQVQITVNPPLTPGTIGAAQTICYNTIPNNLSQVNAPSGGSGSYIFQWQSSVNGSTWSNIPGANHISFNPSALTSTTWYRLNVTSGTCGTISTNQVQITVNAPLTPGSIGNAQTICGNSTPDRLTQLTAATGGTGSYSFQWQNSPDGSEWTNISGANLSYYNPPTLISSVSYRRNVTSGTCGTVSTNQILITVIPALSPGTIGSSQTICYNTIPAGLSQITAPSGGTGSYSFQWQNSANGSVWTNISNANSSVYSPPALTTNTYFRRSISSGCTSYSNSVNIIISPRITSGQLHDSKTILENTSTTFNISISGGTPPFTINYTVNGVAKPELVNYTSGTSLSTGILSAGTYVYALTSIEDVNGCRAQTLGSSIIIRASSNQVYSTNKALIIVNSASSSYSDYVNYIKPYIDNFGIPNDVCNINTTSLPSFTDYAVIIFGHRNTYSSGYPIAQLEAAVSSGVGLCSFDPHLFDYASGFNTLITRRSVSSSQINIPDYTHFVTEYHAPDTYSPNNNIINLTSSWTVSQNSNLVGGSDLATMSSGGQTVSLLQATNYGSGKVVKWCGYDWVFESILGPLYGMDDLFWRGIVWAARKPFVMQGLPPMITMRVDDTDGGGSNVINNFEWITICNEFGIIPWCGTFNNSIPSNYIATLRTLINNNKATASPHAFGSEFIYYNHDGLPSFDAAANAREARDFYLQNGLKISKYFIPHYYEVSSTALPEIWAMGGEFIGTHMLPDNPYYTTPWLNCAPYRINRDGRADWARPVYYAGYVDLSGIRFFICLAEIRDDGGYEWYPDNNVTTTTARGIRHLRRSLNSMALSNLFTHEHFFATITTANWREIIRQITSEISEYNPEYRSMDYAVSYIRAKGNIRITDVRESLNDVEISYAGNNDMDTKCYLFTEQNGQINYRFVVLPRVNGSNKVTTLK